MWISPRESLHEVRVVRPDPGIVREHARRRHRPRRVSVVAHRETHGLSILTEHQQAIGKDLVVKPLDECGVIHGLLVLPQHPAKPS